ncbi:MAG: Cu(I)/Ag(I) efflux system protein CusF [Parasphingorhabdus sp.]|jgi:Cu(I)/Ag(I) efflux system protein CusF
MTLLHTFRRGRLLVSMAFATVLPGPLFAQALTPEEHSTTDEYSSDFSSPIVDFNASLPWKERFTSTGAFDARFSLTMQADANKDTMTEQPEASSMSTDGYDATGVVKDVRMSSNKIKIKHGPIDRLGMPGMTMMFKVADPSLLQTVKKGSKIQFSLDNTDGGFTITKIGMEDN